MPGQTELTEFGGILITIRSRKSYFEVTKAVEERLQRFSVPKLMEYVTHGDRECVEAYVDEVSSPGKFSIFWEMEQGSTMRLAGIPVESKFYLVGNAVVARDLFRYSAAAGLGAPVRVCVSQRDGEERASTWTRSPPSSASFPKRARQMSPGCSMRRWSRSSKTPPRPAA